MNMVAIFYQYFLTNLVSQLINLSIALYGIIIIVSYFILEIYIKHTIIVILQTTVKHP